jgi:hypothetical protein
VGKIIFKLFIPGMLVPMLLVATKQDVMIQLAPRVDNFAFIENQLLESSRYTQMDESNPVILDRFDNQYTLRYREDELALLGFEKKLENEHFALYFEQDSFSLILEDLATGYMFSSRPEFQGYSQNREDNPPNRNQMNSGLWVESISTTRIASSGIRVESLYTIAEVEYQTNGAQNLADVDWTTPYLILPDSYQRNLVITSTTAINENRFSVAVNLPKYGFQFSVSIYLSDQGFGVAFDPTSVSETNNQNRLLGLQFFPYFGATRQDVFPGYMVIPDGVGALVRTNKRYDTTFQSDYYGSDLGYLRSSVAQLSLPLYGLIHSPNGYGFFNEIIQGEEHTTLLANFWGKNTLYNRITNRYNLRRIYQNIVNRAGDGNDVIPQAINPTPFESHYQVLTGNKANYVGIATQYQDNLVKRNQLLANEIDVTPIQLAMLMYEQEPSFLGTSRATLTNPTQVKSISEKLKSRGVSEQTLVLKGWSDDGLSYRQPYYFNMPNRQSFNELMQYSTNQQFSVYLEQDYLVSSELSSRINFNQDVARNFSKLKMRYRLNRLDNQPIDEYYVYPHRAAEKLDNDLSSITNLGVSGLAMPHSGNTLFSYFDDVQQNRTLTKTMIKNSLTQLPGVALHQPNAYLFSILNQYFDMPITNSQFDLYTDLVPLLPIVMKGYIPAFTPYLNFNALGKERLLQMVDFAINPSYILTDSPSAQLRFTYSNRYFTTAFSDFETDIVNTYEYVASALNTTIGASIVGRKMLTTGVSEVIYDNGTIIYVNYRNTDFVTTNGLVKALDYLVIS